MSRIREFFTGWFSKKRGALDAAEADALRGDFKERYHHFKLLLNANNQALQKMADIEQALHERSHFGMPFVRDRCTATSVSVLQMIKNMAQLAPGKHPELRVRFTSINEKINEILVVKKRPREEKLVIPMEAIDMTMADLIGNKMAMLGEVKNGLQLNVPPGFAITTHAYERLLMETGLRDEINRLMQSADIEDAEGLFNLSTRIRRMIIHSEIPREVADAIRAAWSDLEALAGSPLKVAVRSSALGEDSADSSFAGQYNSELNVSGENLLDTYKQVVASKYNLHAIIYRLNRGFRDEDIPMAVGCLRMIDAVCGGVAYSRNPINSKDDAVIINSVWGLPKTVVDGTAPCDLFMMSRKSPYPVIHQDVRVKEIKYARSETGTGLCRFDVDDYQAEAPSLNEKQKTDLAEIAIKLEKYYEHPQDIEWAIGPSGKIYILQSRPLQLKKIETATHSNPVPSYEDETLIVTGGVTASSGAACGDVFVVETNSDSMRFPKGAILVARQALPAWAALLNRAVAVVTAQGGVAGHLASVAREFGIPAIFGLEEDIKKLSHGSTVTVDANNCRIFAGCVNELIKDAAISKPAPTTDRPVYHILKRASEWIVPLNLLDPDSKEFIAGNCQTYHDITRFIHEKSVMEMFNFGKDHHFPERSGKQLYYNVPMQWWVLNLDDGFKDAATGKYIRLQNIVSVPMRAFWDGFAAVPWDGPPAIDGKGLLSVMFRSTTNPALVIGVRSRYAEQNYFMVSKNFCSLNSRLGYHFSTLETLVSSRARENYINFQFKGGAADEERRVGRARFIGSILEKYGFWVKIREDHVSARLQEEDEERTKSRIAIIGYLTLHTRQLDMIMSNEKQVAYYKSKLQNEIDQHILGAP
jgi:pyruvate, water dikinase